jgi:heptosyltransferase III
MNAGRGLIIFPGALGDLICLLPTIRALGAQYPEIEFELMARAELARFAERRMAIVAGHSIDRREIALLFARLDSESPPARNFFCQFDRIDCFFASDNERFRESLRQVARGDVTFYPFRPPGPGHMAQCYLRGVGATVSYPLSCSIELLPDDLRIAQQKLSQFGLEPGSFVLILPGSGSARKNWPAENFARLAERIQLVHPILVVLGPSETDLAPSFHGRSFSTIRELELGELAGIAQIARGFIGNDSGVSHLAAAAGTRGLVIFGPTDPERWRPLGEVKIIQKESLENLLVEQVWLSAVEMLRTGHLQRGRGRLC